MRPDHQTPPHDETGATSRARLELGRLERLRAQLEIAECDAGLFFDPVNIRYATGTTNMQVYSLHNPCRYALVLTSGPVVLFEFKGCSHLAEGHAPVDEVRVATGWYHFAAGPRSRELAEHWADGIASLLPGGSAPASRARVAVHRLDPYGLRALERRFVDVVDGQEVTSLARAVKTADEIVAMRRAVSACEAGLDRLAAHLKPGRTEQEVWAILHQATIESGGEWFETRLLSSGPRTNPWYQECSDRVIESGELVALDTDLVGIDGYAVDISRTWLAGDAPATAEQSRMFHAAHEQLMRNRELLAPGLAFRELAERAHLPPEPLHSPENHCVVHGVGLCNEYPLVLNRDHFEAGGYDGTIEEGMVLCVESLIAPRGGREAVKLEDQVLITASGCEPLSRYPFDQRLLG